MIEPVLLTAARILTFSGGLSLTNASGFYFARDDRLFLVTCRHVLHDPANGHTPDRIEIELHIDPANIARAIGFSILLHAQGAPIWRQGRDAAGDVDIAAIEIDRAAWPDRAVYRAFTPGHLHMHERERPHQVEIGSPLLMLGFPLGFHDALHHLPVARQAVLASSFDLRFQGMGYFLTDARTHRGASGAPVVMRTPSWTGDEGMPWALMGVHAARLDALRDPNEDEALGLNCAWYADILMALTAG